MTAISIAVLMGGRNVTPWVESVTVNQALHCYYRDFTVSLRGWHHVDPSATWDIYASHNEANPYSEVLMRAGVVPPDRLPRTKWDSGVPTTTIQGYDWAWMAQRRMAPSTLVLAPDSTTARNLVLAKGQSIVGRWSWVNAPTLYRAVTELGLLAGFESDIRIPNFMLAGQILDPTKSVWDAIATLVDPLAPKIYFRRSQNCVVYSDRATTPMSVGSTLALPGSVVASVEAGPSTYRFVGRVIIEVPRWL